MKGFPACLCSVLLYHSGIPEQSFVSQSVCIILMAISYDPLQHTSIYQRREDSDDSDAEGGFGNVNRIIMRPPGHSGKAKRGHLCFDASFESGNLGRVDLINEYEYDLFLRPDTCNPRLRFWFNFTVDNVKQDQKVIFNIVNISKSRNLFNDGMTPLVKSSSRQKWQRIPKKYVFYNKSPLHHRQYVLSFAFGFDKEDEVFQFALVPPYTYTRQQQYLQVLESKAFHLYRSFQIEKLGKSLQKRALNLVTIGSLDRTKDFKRRVVAIIARSHPGESPTSLVCQGILELLISSNAIASVLNQYVIFKIIPMLNPDGVFLGNNKSNAMGLDLNRAWNVARTSYCYPTLKSVLELLTNLDKSEEMKLDFVIDLHSHTCLKGCFIYGNTYEDVYRYERHLLFPKLLSSTADDYANSNVIFNADPQKIGTARRYFCQILNDRVNSYTFHVSIFGYNLKGTDIVIPYNEETYMRCGRNLIKALFKYYHQTGIIPAGITNDLRDAKRKKKKRRPKISPNQFSPNRQKIQRIEAQLHFKDLSICYEGNNSSFGESCSTPFRHFLPKHTKYSTRNFSNFVYPIITEPNLSILDFNILTKNGIDKAIKERK